MKEVEYIITTNLVKISYAIYLLNGVLGGNNYGISKEDLSEIVCTLSTAKDLLFKSLEVDE